MTTTGKTLLMLALLPRVFFVASFKAADNFYILSQLFLPPQRGRSGRWKLQKVYIPWED